MNEPGNNKAWLLVVRHVSSDDPGASPKQCRDTLTVVDRIPTCAREPDLFAGEA